MKAFIDEHREAYGVEPICKVLPITPPTDYEHVARRANPARQAARIRAIQLCVSRSSGYGMKTFKSTVCARSGGSCCAWAWL
jgi:hypothetical protein